MPSMICVGCVHQVDSWHGFKNTCDSSQIKLNAWLQKNKPDVYEKVGMAEYNGVVQYPKAEYFYLSATVNILTNNYARSLGTRLCKMFVNRTRLW